VEGRLALVSAADGAVNWERSSGKLSLAELASVHAEADAGTLRGKVVVVPAPA